MYNNSRRSSGGFKSGGFKGGGKRFGGGGGRDGGFRDGGRPQMHPATCSQCGTSCEVPFRPNGSKPIFCSNCFKRDEGGSEHRSEFRERKPFSGGNGGGVDASVGLQLKVINQKLDALLELFSGDEDEDSEDESEEGEVEGEGENAK